ncbi:MAG TPA: helix-turn-helix domain-containing protein [Acidimicrobiales bacterium]|nr:helix-turn-helix domain-containing protein [Acidimicrobiales bacterium]
MLEEDLIHLHYYWMQVHGRQSDDTRERLVEAAEQLFAEHGIGGVSLREINRAAGAKNAVAVQYHFGDRAGIVRAITAKHFPAVDARRHAMLDEYAARGHDDIRALAAAWVRPLASKLDDHNGGLEFLQIYAELTNLPPAARSDGEGDRDVATDSIQRWRLLVEPFLDDDATRLHRRYAVMRFSATEIGRRARSGPHRDDHLFVSDLIDMVTAMLAAQPSRETTRLMAERDKHRSRK